MLSSSPQAQKPAVSCLFCRSGTSQSKAEEHIIPASLGNEEHVLPAGLVCDKCNNYFGRKLEQPVLASDYFQTLRARQDLTSRAGNPLLWDGFAFTGGSRFKASFSNLEKRIYFEPRDLEGTTTIDAAMARAKAANTGGSLYLPHGIKEPEPKILSRFFAKIGLEVLAHKLLGDTDFATVLYDAQFDLVRNWARYGTGALHWSIHRRRLYDENRTFTDAEHPDGYQLLHEFMLLVTEINEWYAVVCLFGEEFVINLGGPETEGYELWLKRHDHQSPLYSGNNASSQPV